MANSTHMPPGSYGCYTKEVESECFYLERYGDPACWGCKRRDGFDWEQELKKTQESWARRWGIE